MALTTPFFKAFGPLLFGRPAARKAAQKLRRRAGSLDDLYELFGHFFSDKLLECAEKGVNSRARRFTPKTTFWAFVSQVLSPGSSCREAVRKVEAWWRHAQSETFTGMSPDSSAYCQARARLDLKTLELINQARWPQSRSQKPGLGFPCLKLVGLSSRWPAARFWRV